MWLHKQAGLKNICEAKLKDTQKGLIWGNNLEEAGVRHREVLCGGRKKKTFGAGIAKAEGPEQVLHALNFLDSFHKILEMT